MKYSVLRIFFFYSISFIMTLFPSAYAAEINKSDTTWGPLVKFILNIFSGDPAIIASLIAFFMGIVLAMRTHHKLAALSGGLIIAIAFQIGPNIVEHLTGALI